MRPWNLLRVKQVYGGWRPIVQKTFVHPKGHEVTVDVLDSHDDAAVIAITPEGKAVIAKQYRCGPEKVMHELAGGAVDEGESPEDAAIRELAEEVGYKPGKLESLGYIYREGWRNGKSHYFLATDCMPLSKGQDLDDFEVIEVELISISELIDNAKNARMTCTGGVMLAYDRLKELEKKYETTN